MTPKSKFQLTGRPGAIQMHFGLYPEPHLVDRGRKIAEMVLRQAHEADAKAKAAAKRAARAARNIKNGVPT